MNERPFPKPPPTNPLPLETWLRRTDRAESGREAFFRGRDTEYGVFRSTVMSLNEDIVGGGTLIFQGAPGAGKSALMAECMEAIQRHSTPEAPWVAVSMHPDSLQSPVDVIESLVDAVNTESERLREKASGIATIRILDDLLGLGRTLYRELSERGGGALGLSVGPQRDEKVTAGRVFRNAASLLGKFHIVVCVDEAQNTPVLDTTRGVLDCLHRDPQGIPLVTVFFGLSDTQDVLQQCGLSRFARGRVVNLDPLPSDDAACAIRDTLQTYGFTASPEDRTAWVDHLTRLSQGWPQHINSVSVAACDILKAGAKQLDSAQLDEALSVAEKYKREYYAGRLAAGSSPPWVYRQMALVAEQKNGVLSYDDLRQFSAAKTTLGDFLTNALHAGLLAPTKNLPYHYRIPIPSFGDYLRMLPVEPPQSA